MEPGSMSFVFVIFAAAVVAGVAVVFGMVWLNQKLHAGKGSAHGH